MVGTFKTIHLIPKSQVRIIALPYSPQVSIWMLVGSQGNFRYTLRVVITFKSIAWAKSASLYDQNRYSYPIGSDRALLGPIGLKFGPTIDPILFHLTQIFTGVSSNNLMYPLVVVSILKNVQ